MKLTSAFNSHRTSFDLTHNPSRFVHGQFSRSVLAKVLEEVSTRVSQVPGQGHGSK